MFYLYSISLYKAFEQLKEKKLISLYKAFEQLKEKKLIIRTRLAVDNLSGCNSKLNVKERQFKI